MSTFKLCHLIRQWKKGNLSNQLAGYSSAQKSTKENVRQHCISSYLDDSRYFLPLLLSWVRSCWIVSRHVKQNDRLLRSILKTKRTVQYNTGKYLYRAFCELHKAFCYLTSGWLIDSIHLSPNAIISQSIIDCKWVEWSTFSSRGTGFSWVKP